MKLCHNQLLVSTMSGSSWGGGGGGGGGGGLDAVKGVQEIIWKKGAFVSLGKIRKYCIIVIVINRGKGTDSLSL